MKTVEKARKFTKALITRNLEFVYWGMPCRLEHVSSKKLLNLALFELGGGRRWSKSVRYPTELQVETSRVCNLHCPLCPAGMGLLEGPPKIMPFHVFRSIIDEVGDYLLMVMLWGYGEPMQNPKLADMVAYARSKGIVTIVSTNGQCLNTREKAERLVSSGLDCLVVNMDGASQETYSQYRMGGYLHKVIQCLELVQAARKSLATDRPVVNVQTIVTKRNENELQQIADLARELGADVITRLSAHMSDYTGNNADERFAPINPRYRRFEYRDGKRIRRSINDYCCDRPSNRLTVAWDGTVISCVQDYNSLYPFGTMGNGVSFKDIWYGEKAASFRRRFRRNKSSFSFCDDCHFRDNIGANMVEAIPLREQR